MAEQLDVTIVTGLSGAGKSQAAAWLEDLGLFVIDNLPPALIPKVAELAVGGDRPARYALVVDIRSGAFMDEMTEALVELRSLGARTRILFLEASDETLVRRFENTRRRHPLAAGARVTDGIARERAVLEELRSEADIVLDTTGLNVHDLRNRLRAMFETDAPENAMQTSILSFGYKHGLPLDADLVFDCRFLPNPHWVEDLRPLTGLDPKVRRYVLAQEETGPFLDELERLFTLLMPAYVREGKSYLTIAVGCTGGRHRSVVVSGELAKTFERLGFHPNVSHRDIERA